MKKSYLFCVLALLFSAISCREVGMELSPEKPAESETPGTAHIPTGFTACLAGPYTKTAADMTTGIITWLEDDPILVSNGQQAIPMYVENGGTTEAELYARDDVFDGTEFYAVYPAEHGAYASGVFSSVIPSTQSYARGGFASETFPMVAICGKDRRFAFKNAASLLRIETSTESFPSDISIASVTVTADEPLSGPIEVAYSLGNAPQVDCSGGDRSVSLLGPAEGIPFGVPVYVVVAPGSYHHVRVRLLLSNGLSFTGEEEALVNVDRSAYATVSVKAEARFTDLSATETANCYMLKESGAYKFRATVKGNGVETSCGLPAETDGIAGVKVYYSDGISFVDGDFALIDDYICFTTVPGTLPTGTALVSALDEEGKTLWSWHIWANSDIADVELSDGSVWLNMNLGAHQVEFNASGFNGYYYQWGRKDPFLQRFTNSTASSVMAPFVSHASQVDGSLENAIANPQVFYGGNCLNGNDLSTQRIEDWSSYSDEEKVYDWWNKDITGDGQVTVEASKTMFDPCPAGYHVPVKAELDALLARVEEDSSVDAGGRSVEGKLYFPYTSYRYVAIYTNWWPGGKEAARIFVPSATPSETTTRHHRRYYRLYMTSSNTQGIPVTGIRTHAVPVRCIKKSASVEPQSGDFGSTLEPMVLDDWN